MNFWSMCRGWTDRFNASRSLWHRTTTGYSGGVPWRPSTKGAAEDVYQTNDSLQWALANKGVQTNKWVCCVTRCGTLQPPCQESFSVFFFYGFSFKFHKILFWGKDARAEDGYEQMGRWMGWGWSFEIHKEAIKCFRKKEDEDGASHI